MERRNDESQKPNEQNQFLRSPQFWLVAALLTLIGVYALVSNISTADSISLDFLRQQLSEGNVAKLTIGTNEIQGEFRESPKAPVVDDKGQPKATKQTLTKKFRVTISGGAQAQSDFDKEFQEINDRFRAAGEPEKVVDYVFAQPSDHVLTIIWMIAILLPLAFVFWIWLQYRRTRNDIMGGGFLGGFSRSPAKRYEASRNAVTFKDVAGLESVKEDLQEIVDFLRSPDKFRKLGGRIPKGVLLFGPPGTGKTLLARAVAGEAGVPYFSVNGSEFIQMFVGVGASRVRDLFRTAREQSPAIIFIDEIDAVGRQRGAGLGGGHDEREQTLNQILSEMDGFGGQDSVIVVAATNRPDVLDPALLRPGRFDRHVTVDRPNVRARKQIFKVHVRNVPLSDDVNIGALAANSAGMTGADIRNVVNEAALWAARQNKTSVDSADFEHAYDKVTLGAKRDDLLNPRERKKAAYHEAGHAIAGWKLPNVDPIHKATIIARGRTGGRVQFRREDDQSNMSEAEITDWLTMALAGRAAEKLVFDDVNTGASNDLERATQLARNMVTQWGMSERLGPVSYKLSDDDPFLGREMHQQRQFSEHTMELIDEEVSRVLNESAARATELLIANREDFEKLAQTLLEREELTEAQIEELLGPPVRSKHREKHEDPAHLDHPDNSYLNVPTGGAPDR